MKEIAYLNFTVLPAGVTAAQMGGLDWTVHAGSGIVWIDEDHDGVGTYAAPSTSSSVTMRLTVLASPSKDRHVDMGFTVTPPTGINKFIQKPGSGIKHVKGVASVGFLAWWYLLPKDVSFVWITFGEGDCDADLNGWFLLKFPTGLHHDAWGACSVGTGNITDGCRVEGDDQVYGQEVGPPIYSNGWFTWVIPQRYHVFGGSWYPISTTTLTHRVDLDAAGKLTIQKGGVGPFSKDLDADHSDW